MAVAPVPVVYLETHLMPDERYRDLIHRRLTGSISPGEDKQLSDWIAESKANTAYYAACRKFYNATHEEFSDAESETYWLELKERIERYESAKTARRPYGWSSTYWKMAAGFLLLVLATLLVGRLYFRAQLIRVENLSNVALMHHLPDNSIIWLNQGSAISYSREFGKSERKLTLSGEGLFEVTENPQKPFVVSLLETEVKVLGTSFNVRSLEDSPTVHLSVLKGSVTFRELAGSSTVVVSAGAAAAYDRMSKRIRRINKADPNVLSWKTGVLSFEKAALAEVVQALNHHYNTDISFDKEIASCKFTGSIRNLPVKQAIEIVALSLNLETETFDDRIFLKGYGCK